ncbi:MAG: aldo/keto reductase family protein [Anaerolineae bacterium]|jgi:voltage-dependent potassium channel beta subunit|nr:aldo/keto reductase family protein [Anaerolineae bacterium]
MEYRRMGSTGTQISVISLGAWLTYGSETVAFETAKECIRTAIEAGINYIDVADIYSGGKAEETLGKAIKGLDRTKLVISTKAYFPMSDDVNDRGLSRKHLFESVHKSLKRLGTDYVDIFFCHRYDLNTRTDETVRALDDLIRQGKILYWGTSMWEAWQIEEAFAAAERFQCYAPVIEQPIYNMLDRYKLEEELEDLLTNRAMSTVVWSPLAGGLLTGKYNDGIPADTRFSRATEPWMIEQFAEHRVQTVRALSGLARSIGTTPAALALAWAIQHPNVDSAIIGATKPAHITENLKALDVVITPEVEAQIEAILQNRPAGSSRGQVAGDHVIAL